MNNYNNNTNFPRAPGSDSQMRFKKRPRYNVNSSGANNSPRYNKYQNQTGYQFSPNRNSAADNYQHSQYEKQPNQYFYSHSTKRLNSNYSPQQNNKQSSNFLHKSIPTNSPSKFSQSTQNKKLPSHIERQATNTTSVAPTAQNNQHQPIFTPNNVTNTEQNNQNQTPFAANNVDNTNYYGFPYNYFPTSYGGNPSHNTSTPSFSVVEGMTSYLWQTITSTPPPNLQQHPPLPQRQPTALPPLPVSEVSHLPPPPPIPSSITDSQYLPTFSENMEQNNQLSCQDPGAKTIVKMKAKRKAMSERYKLSKSWSEKAAQLALEAEEANVKKLRKDFILVIRFPDPEISREMVKNYSPDIESVHFQLNYAPRYCLIHLKPDADVEKTIDHLSKIPFGTGYLTAEIKQVPHKVHSTKLNEIDPFTLYVGNLPTTIACKTLKELFPGATRIDIGFAQRMKYTRYAFIRYQNVHHAIEAYRRMLDAEIEGRTLTIRFRRLTSASEGNKDADAENADVLHDDIVSSQSSTVPQNESQINELVSTAEENVNMTESLVDKSTNAGDDITKLSEQVVTRECNNTDMMPAQMNSSMETNNTNENPPSPTSTNAKTETCSEKNPNEIASNIKPEPNVDPADIVTRNTAFEAHNEQNIDNVKVERALFEEFFERPLDPNDRSENLSRSTRNSLTSSTDDTDTISQLSSNSLGDFLQTCQRLQTHGKNLKTAEQSRNKVSIKSEPMDTTENSSRENLTMASKTPPSLRSIKMEDEDNDETIITSGKSVRETESEAYSLSRKRASANIENPANNSSNNDDDDIVPPTALFFTSEYQNKWAKSKSNCDNENFYAEFYDTNVSTQATTSQSNIKTEPVESSIDKNTIRLREKKQRTDLSNLSRSVSSNQPLMEMSSKRPAIKLSEENADDDLVPQPNLLGGYQRNKNVVKQENEYDDIFSKPFPDSMTNCKDLLVSNSSTHTKQSEIVTEVLEPQAKQCLDEDVVIVSANIPPAKIQKKSDNPLLNNIYIPRYNDIVSFNNKPISVTTPNRKASSFFHHNHLDRLYDQLDTDSDSEL